MSKYKNGNFKIKVFLKLKKVKINKSIFKIEKSKN